MKRLLIIEGLPGSGKSYMVDKLKKEFSKITFMKHTRDSTRKRILDNKTPILDPLIFDKILEDSQWLGKALNLHPKGTIVVERFVLSTLITMELSKDNLPSNIFKDVRYYYENILKIPFEDILCINIQHKEKDLSKILEDRDESYYKFWGASLSAAKNAEKLSVHLIDRYFPEVWILNLDRELAYERAVKFLKGGN